MLITRPSRLQEIALIWIATNEPSIGWKIGRESGISSKESSGTIYVCLSGLERKGLVTSKKLKKNKKRKENTKGQREYSLTVYGLIHALLYIEPERLQSVTKAWPDLIPLVTDKWDFFASAGVEDLAIRRLEKSTREMFFLILVDAPAIAIDLICTDAIFMAYFFSTDIGTYNDEDRQRWAEACREDPEIRDYFSMRRNLSILAHAKEIAATEIMLDTLEGNEGKKKQHFLTDDFVKRLPLRGTSAYRSMMSHFFHIAGMSPPEPLFSEIMDSNPASHS